MLKAITHVNLTIAPGEEALATALHFYVDLLGLTRLPRPNDIDGGRPGLWLGFGNGQQIHISAEAQAASYNAPSNRHAAFEVEDLAALRQLLSEAGAALEDASKIPGQSRFFARDPWGNRLEFMQLD
jgi:catechol 2,3-dioxygenase-like lactoylglutathione lyase family enzyme